MVVLTPARVAPRLWNSTCSPICGAPYLAFGAVNGEHRVARTPDLVYGLGDVRVGIGPLPSPGAAVVLGHPDGTARTILRADP